MDIRYNISSEQDLTDFNKPMLWKHVQGDMVIMSLCKTKSPAKSQNDRVVDCVKALIIESDNGAYKVGEIYDFVQDVSVAVTDNFSTYFKICTGQVVLTF